MYISAMNLKEIFSYPESTKRWDSTETQIVPFIGVETIITGENAGTERVGIGIRESSNLFRDQFYGNSEPLQIIRSYRAIILLQEQVENIQLGTMKACLSLVGEHNDPSNGLLFITNLMHLAIPSGHKKLEDLRKKGVYIPPIYEANEALVCYVLAAEKFDKNRRDILTRIPPIKQLEAIIISARKHDVTVCIEELVREVKSGRLEATPLIEALLSAP